MDNIITGVLGVGLFMAFVIGLANSIGALPFVLIVVIVSGMALYDLYENINTARLAKKTKAN